jgi:arsenite methyltransferase
MYMQKPHYGLDAPGLIRFFFMAGSAVFALLIIILFTAFAGPTLKMVLTILFGIAATYLLGMGSLMIYCSMVMKLKDNQRLLNLIPWSGSELVLDVGCGRGLMLINAAKRLSTGKATGIDLWQEQDQADNSSSATLKNAAIEGVMQRIEVQTADMRKLPFPDNQFDIVTSNWTIHNLEVEADRQTTLLEIIRVLKPNGIAIINDIVNQIEYADYFKLHGMKNVQLHNNGVRDTVLKAVSFGSFAPSAVSARKSA